MNQHGRLAQEYWETYRPSALTELGGPEQQKEFFTGLGMRVLEAIGQTTDDLLLQIPSEQRAGARPAVRAQAQELIYDEQIYLPKEAGTEHREM
jgi:hypothetical protein